jgi:hypothetical protein
VGAVVSGGWLYYGEGHPSATAPQQQQQQRRRRTLRDEIFEEARLEERLVQVPVP